MSYYLPLEHVSKETRETPQNPEGWKKVTPKYKRLSEKGQRLKYSPIWKYFTEVEQRKFARCNICNADVYLTNGGTTGLLRHVDWKHQFVREDIGFTSREKKSKQENYEEWKKKFKNFFDHEDEQKLSQEEKDAIERERYLAFGRISKDRAKAEPDDLNDGESEGETSRYSSFRYFHEKKQNYPNYHQRYRQKHRQAAKRDKQHKTGKIGTQPQNSSQSSGGLKPQQGLSSDSSGEDQICLSEGLMSIEPTMHQLVLEQFKSIPQVSQIRISVELSTNKLQKQLISALLYTPLDNKALRHNDQICFWHRAAAFSPSISSVIFATVQNQQIECQLIHVAVIFEPQHPDDLQKQQQQQLTFYNILVQIFDKLTYPEMIGGSIMMNGPKYMNVAWLIFMEAKKRDYVLSLTHSNGFDKINGRLIQNLHENNEQAKHCIHIEEDLLTHTSTEELNTRVYRLVSKHILPLLNSQSENASQSLSNIYVQDAIHQQELTHKWIGFGLTTQYIKSVANWCQIPDGDATKILRFYVNRDRMRLLKQQSTPSKNSFYSQEINTTAQPICLRFDTKILNLPPLKASLHILSVVSEPIFMKLVYLYEYAVTAVRVTMLKSCQLAIVRDKSEWLGRNRNIVKCIRPQTQRLKSRWFCDCKLSETVGLPCQHILAVISHCYAEECDRIKEQKTMQSQQLPSSKLEPIQEEIDQAAVERQLYEQIYNSNNQFHHNSIKYEEPGEKCGGELMQPQGHAYEQLQQQLGACIEKYIEDRWVIQKSKKVDISDVLGRWLAGVHWKCWEANNGEQVMIMGFEQFMDLLWS